MEYAGVLLVDIPFSICLPQAALDSVSTGQSLPLEREVVAFFDAYRDRLFRYVLSFGLHAHDSEDIVQEVFLLLFRHLQMEKSRENLRGWLFRVAHNLALKRRTSIQKPEFAADPDALLLSTCPDPNPDPEQQLAFRQRQARLLAVVRALPEQDVRCLRLRAEGLTYREIAAVLDISLGSVSIALSRSLARLQRADLG